MRETKQPRWLTTLLQLREQERDQCRAKLQEAEQAATALAQRADEIDADSLQLLQQRRDAGCQGVVNVNELISAQRHQLLIDGQQQTLMQQTKLLQEEQQRRHDTLVEADRQVKSLEKLAEKKHAQQVAAQRQSEQATLDEAAAIRHSRGSDR